MYSSKQPYGIWNMYSALHPWAVAIRGSHLLFRLHDRGVSCEEAFDWQAAWSVRGLRFQGAFTWKIISLGQTLRFSYRVAIFYDVASFAALSSGGCPPWIDQREDSILPSHLYTKLQVSTDFA